MKTISKKIEHMDKNRNGTFFNRSLERALQILNVFNNQRQSLTVAQISEVLSLPRATVLRLCTTLVKYNYLKQDADSKQYSLGMKLFELGSFVFYSFSLRNVASPYLTELQIRLGKTIFLGIIDNDDLLYIDKRDDPQTPISFTSKIGTRRAPYWGLLGPVLLAYIPEAEIERLLQKCPLVATTKKSVTNKEEFKKMLRRIEGQGYFIDLETAIEGIGGVAAPIRDYTGKVIAGLGIAFIASLIDSRGLKKLVKEVVNTALAISHEMGYHETRGRHNG